MEYLKNTVNNLLLQVYEKVLCKRSLLKLLNNKISEKYLSES